MSSYLDSILQTPATSASSTTATTKTNDVLGKQDFLTLLVAQLQNQDPLNPDDPTQFTAQLAQFSSLEQLFNLNDSMGSLASAYQNTDKLGTLNTIGKEVAYTSSSFNYDGNPVVLGYNLDGQASKVTVSLQKDGATIALLNGSELSEGTHYINWDGMTANGQQASVGEYKIVVQAKSAEGDDLTASSVIRSLVTGIDLEGENGGTLITNSGKIAFNAILGVYEPDSSV